MKLLKTSFMLLSVCWGLSLRFKLFSYSEPLITPANKVMLGVKIPNLWSALFQAYVYTISAIWALQSKSRTLQGRNFVVRYNFNWMYMMPFLMHCTNSFWINLKYILATLATPAVLQSTNFVGVFLKLYLIIFLHFVSLLEIALLMYNWVRRLYLRGERVF
ncbi:hypothetical protein ACLKA6_010953 [Drosophila palustris]